MKLQVLLTALILTLLPGHLLWADEELPAECQFLLPVDTFEVEQEWNSMEKPKAFRFRSAMGNGRIKVTADVFLGESGAKVYLNSEHLIVVKVFGRKQARREAQFEVLATEYLRSQGKNLPEILDYSSNIFQDKWWSPESPVVIVKKYHHGWNKNQRSQKRGMTKLFADNFMNLLSEYNQAIKGFPQWLSTHENGQKFLENGRPRPLDLYGGNWLLTPTGWMLIDP